MSEESRQEQALALARRAREALPPELAAHLATGVEAAVSLLAQAVERLADDSPGFKLDLDEYGPGQLEQIRERIFGSQPQSDTEAKFIISFPAVELSASDIWNRDEIPEYPTPADVIERMDEMSGNVLGTVVDWDLVDSLSVRDANDATGDGEIEWAD